METTCFFVNDNDIAERRIVRIGELTEAIALRAAVKVALDQGDDEQGNEDRRGDRDEDGEHLELPRIMEGEPQAAEGERGEQDGEGGHAATSGMENVPALMAAMSARISG
jgi:hypothetical protein